MSTRRDDPADNPNIPHCDQCQMLNINGINCHETGCPNSKKTWVPDREWVLFLQCTVCGSKVEQGETCDCQQPDEDDPYDDDDEDADVVLPEDPDTQNNDRTEWAQQALDAFMSATRADACDALSDLLANLGHWCDRNGTTLGAELERAKGHYIEEAPNGTQFDVKVTPKPNARSLQPFVRFAPNQEWADYRRRAKAEYHEDGVIEIDDNAVVSIGEGGAQKNGGAYVEAWVWVYAENEADAENEAEAQA